jgi:hypothetical protein
MGSVSGDKSTLSASKAATLTWARLSCFIPLQRPDSNIHSGISNAGDLFSSPCTQRSTTPPLRRAST